MPLRQRKCLPRAYWVVLTLYMSLDRLTWISHFSDDEAKAQGFYEKKLRLQRSQSWEAKGIGSQPCLTCKHLKRAYRTIVFKWSSLMFTERLALQVHCLILHPQAPFLVGSLITTNLQEGSPVLQQERSSSGVRIHIGSFCYTSCHSRMTGQRR